MADEKLDRLKRLMKDRDFDWPSQEQLRANRLERDRNVPKDAMPKKRKSTQKEGMAVPGAPQRRTGDMADVGVAFCPIVAVSKYPYRFMSSHGPANKFLSQRVSDVFFAGGQFWQRGWSVYYIYPPKSVSAEPLLVVPASEVSTLLQEITELTDKKATFPSGHDRGFVIEFPDDGTPRPRFLDTCHSKDAFDAMGAQVPAPDSNDIVSDDRSLSAFKAKLEAAIRATRNKNTASKAKKKAGRINQKRGWCSQLRRTQRYLGLRPPRGPHDDSDPGVDQQASPEDQHAAIESYQAEVTAKLPAINVDDFVPHPLEDSVVFISLDVECWERSTRQVTEIGISTLDTKDIQNLSPGAGAKDWMSCIKSRHFRIKEYQHLINTDFVLGCPDRFEKAFGVSEFISLTETPQVLASCFKPPFGFNDARNMPMGPLTQRERLDQGWGMDVTDAQGIFITDDPRKMPRKVVLVGHDVSQDISYLRQIGYDPSAMSTIVEVVDTAHLYQAWKQEDQLKSLGSVLGELDITGWNLHNAGNDAAYTLQALLALSLAAVNTISPAKSKTAEREAKVEAAKLEAEERVRSGFEEWDTARQLDEVEPTLEERLRPLKIAEGKRKSVDAAGPKDTMDSNTKTSIGKSTPEGKLTQTAVTSVKPTNDQATKPVGPLIEKSKPQNSKSRYNAKKPKNANATANNAISKSLAALKAAYAAEIPLSKPNPKSDKPKHKKSKQPASTPGTKQPVVLGDLAHNPRFGTDRHNASHGINANLSQLNRDTCNDAFKKIDAKPAKDEPSYRLDASPKPVTKSHGIAQPPKSEPSHWADASSQPTTKSHGITENAGGGIFKLEDRGSHRGCAQIAKPNNTPSKSTELKITEPNPTTAESGPFKPRQKYPRTQHTPQRRPARRIGGIVREEYQHPPEIMRLPKHLRPAPPPGWRVPPVAPSSRPAVQPQFATRGVKEEDDDDAAYGIVDVAELSGANKKGKEKEEKGWIGDRPASWWKEKARREREEDGVFESVGDEEGASEVGEWELGLPVDGGTLEMEGEGEDWGWMDGVVSSAW